MATVGDLLVVLETALRGAGEAQARREACDIVAAVLDVSRHWPMLHREQPATSTLTERAVAAAEARTRGAPFAYAVGRACFRGLTLEVDDRVLIPRPETEGLIDVVIERAAPGGLAVDVGTGSGAIALALAHEGRFERIIATDVSVDAAAVAAANTQRLAPTLRALVEVRTGAHLDPVRGLRARAIVSNPPYISWAEAAALPSSVRDWEPPVALLSGASGLDATSALVQTAAEVLEPHGLLALEVDATRAPLVATLIGGDGRYAGIAVDKDLFGRERYVSALRRSGD